MNIKRYTTSFEFPPYRFLPGQNVHPTKEGGYMFGKGEPECPPIDEMSPERCEYLRQALDLYNHRFYWEAHVYLEALWNAHNRKGEAADFFRALILFAAAGVKRETNNLESEKKLLMSAVSMIQTIILSKGNSFLGFNLSELIIDKHPTQIHPSWS